MASQAGKIAELQMKIKENNNDLTDFLGDLNRWNQDIQNEDQNLKNSARLEKNLPSIRSQKQASKNQKQNKEKAAADKERIKSYDYAAWDKFDVDKACEESSSGDEEIIDDDEQLDEKVDQERRVHLALLEKEKGNQLFKDGKYEASINRYAKAISFNPKNPIFYANRAMALIKVERYAAAEKDCTSALSLDLTYAKALARRATAREKLHKLDLALDDHKNLLKLEPNNKQSISAIANIEKSLIKQPRKIQKPPGEESNKSRITKPLKRIKIQVVGKNEPHSEIVESTKVVEKSKSSPTKNKPTKPEVDVSMLGVPSSSFVFESQFKQLKHNQRKLYEYIKIIPTSSYEKLFSQCIDSLISPMINLIHDFYFKNDLEFYNELKCLSKVSRFEMATMFLSLKDKNTLKILFQNIKGEQTSEEISCLAKKYSVKI